MFPRASRYCDSFLSKKLSFSNIPCLSFDEVILDFKVDKSGVWEWGTKDTMF